MAYKVTDYWSPEHERGLAWDDPALAIAWPAQPPPRLLDRDCGWPVLSALESPFVHLAALAHLPAQPPSGGPA